MVELYFYCVYASLAHCLITSLSARITLPFTLTDIAKLTATEWEKADTSVREQLRAEYKREMVDYVAAQVKYNQILTDEQREEIKKAKIEIAESKEKRLLRKVVYMYLWRNEHIPYINMNCASSRMYGLF
jgi:hypothetical protein